MFTTAEKSKTVTSAPQQQGKGTFFRKAGENSFFDTKESSSFFGFGVQPKLSVSQPDDPYEKEADQTADTVMRMPEAQVQEPERKEEKDIQRKAEEEQEELVQPKLILPQVSSLQRIEDADEDEQESTIQRSGRGPPAATDSGFENTLSSSKWGGSQMPDTTRTFMESRFNADFGGVRIHTDSTAQTLSRSINAQAFTHGNDIYFNSNKYAPGTASGGHLLAHELTHTIQQGASKSVSPKLSRKPMLQRSAEAAVPQLSNAVAKAKGEEGKVNANKEGPDGNREGWERLIEYFKTTFGEDKIIRNGQAPVDGAVAEDHIKKKSTIEGPRPAKPRPADNGPYMRDAMPSWCGIFVFWALNKGGVPMPKWELGGRMVTPEAAYPPGYVPKAGDIAYRDNYSHYALVEKSDGTTVTTVNGNTSGEDNLGAQVQTRDHPLAEWTAFFDPIKLKTGALGSGEGAVEEKPKTLRELRKELFNVNRKEEAEPEKEQETALADEALLQTKPEMSTYSVNAAGELHNAQPAVQAKTEEELQAKENEEQEEFAGSVSEHDLQRRIATSPQLSESVSRMEYPGDAAMANAVGFDEVGGVAGMDTVQRKEQEEISETDRGPPVGLTSSTDSIQCSWFDDAWSTVTDFVAESLAEGKRMLLSEARDFVMAIPGYRALRVVLGEDPITGEGIERNGHTFIEAAFDIMPGGRLLHEKLSELGALDSAAAWIDQQIVGVESLVGAVLSRVGQFIESITLERLASPRALFEEAGNIIHSTVQSIIDFAVTAARELLETVKRFLIEQIVTFVREQTPAYPLLRVILGKDPVTDEEVARNGTNILDALLELCGEEGVEQRKQMQETSTFQKVAAWIDEGILVFEGAYYELKASFLAIWDSVSIEMLMHPIDTFHQIYAQFVAPVQRILDFVVRAAAAILTFIKEVLMRRLSAWARTVRGYHLMTVIIGKDPFTDELVPFSMENVIRGFMSLMDGGDAQFDQLKESGAIERTTARITAAVERLNMTPAYIIQLFIDLWNSFSLNDLADPLAAFQRIIDRFGEPIGRLIAFVVEIVRIVIEVILQVMNFPSALIANIIAKAMQAFEMIKADPVGFLKNLLRAIKKGFMQFFDNIVQHLLRGLVGWLTSELKDAGVPELNDLSLRGVIGWVLQVLDVTMEKIWEKLAAHPRIGPERVARIRGMINTLEGIWTFIRDVQERGMAAIWEKIQEQLSNLWETILGAVKNWIMEQIVNRMVTRLLSMLDPTGIMAVVNSAIALYSAIQSFIKYLREMLEIVNSFVEGVVDIASGNITTAANYLEQTMARAVPIVIGFLANQVGLSGIGHRVGEMIGQARAMVDEALTWLVNRAVDTGFAIFDRLMTLGRSAAGAVMGWLGLRKTFTSDAGADHIMHFQGSGPTAQLIIESTPMRVDLFLSNAQTAINADASLTPDVKQNKLSKIPLARQKVTAIRALTNPPGAATAAPVPNQEQQVTALVNELSDLIRVIDVSGNAQVVPPATFTPGFNSGKSYVAEARYVYKDSAGQKNHQAGQAASAYRGNLSGALDMIKTLELRSVWVAFHVINEHLGGKAVDSNLVPTPRYINGEYNRAFEEPLKTHYQQGKPVWMTAVASYRSDKPDFLSNFEASGGGMKFEGGNWIEDPALQVPSFSRGIDLPPVERIAINQLPPDPADWYLIVNLTPLQTPVLTIAKEKGGGAIGSKQGLKDLIDLHAASYGYKGSYVSNMKGQVDNANLDF